MSWRLQVLGTPTLRGGVTILKPERRMAALLTYLALEGPTSRAKLAALLWPDSDDRTARNNLVQTLRRLKKTTLTNLVTGNDLLQLSEVLEVDVATLNIRSFQGNYQAVLKFPGDLLTYQYDDLLAFSDWLLLERDKLSQLRSEALINLTEQAEVNNDFSAALTYAATLLQLDPINEETYRLLMRLHYLSGNRSEALKIFEKCKTVLRTELGVEPLPETQRLAAAMSAGQLETPVPNVHKTSVPLSVLRPPVLVGREHDWQQLEVAWQGGKVIFLGGEPGVGKTRLIQAFTEAKGVHHFFASRPGDEGVPLSSLARAMRQLLENHDLSLEPWVYTELSRLSPHLSKTAPAPIIAESDKLRFYEAVAETLERTIMASTVGVIWDDLQYFDAASFEVWHYLLNRFAAQESSAPLCFINVFRKGELPSQHLAAAEQMVAHDRAVYIELEPLSESHVNTLLATFDLKGLRAIGSALTRYTGGNPMFILETLKSLLESGQLEHGLPLHFPMSGKVATVIQKRLERLSTTSLKLARIAAVASTDFSPELAHSILELDALELSEPFAELERMQVLQGTTFTHDLIYEATRAGIPAPVKMLLHGRVATWLELTKANPARIAQHYLNANDEAKAALFFLKAAEEARHHSLFVEAADFYQQAAVLLEKLGDQEAVFDALARQTELLVKIDTRATKTALLNLTTLARTSAQHLELLQIECNYLTFVGEAKLLESRARKGLELATKDITRADFSFHLGHSLWLQNRAEAALPYLEQALALRHEQQDPLNVAEITIMLGGVLFEVNRFSESEDMLKQAERRYKALGRDFERANVLNELAINTLKQGYPKKALNQLLEAETIFKKMTGVGYDYIDVLHVTSVCWVFLAEESKFLNTIEQALTLSARDPTGFSGALHLSLGHFYTRMGEFEKAEESFQQALSWPGLPTYYRPAALRGLARIRVLTGNDPSSLFNEVERLLRDVGNPTQDVCAFLLLKAQWVQVSDAIKLATKATKLALANGFMGEAILSLTRYAQALLASGKLKKALETIKQASEILEETQLLSYRTEVQLTSYQILATLKSNEATVMLEKALAWLLEVARDKVPPHYRESFLTKNPVNKAVLDAAKEAGLMFASS